MIIGHLLYLLSPLLYLFVSEIRPSLILSILATNSLLPDSQNKNLIIDYIMNVNGQTTITSSLNA